MRGNRTRCRPGAARPSAGSTRIATSSAARATVPVFRSPPAAAGACTEECQVSHRLTRLLTSRPGPPGSPVPDVEPEQGRRDGQGIDPDLADGDLAPQELSDMIHQEESKEGRG